MYLLNKRQNNIILMIIGLFFLSCTACENKKERLEKPIDLLEKKAFEAILLEVYLIEGDVRFHLRNEHLDSLRIRITTQMNAMYKENNTDHEQFTKSYIYYMNDPTLSAKIMKNISNQLVEMQAKEEVRQKDTIA